MYTIIGKNTLRYYTKHVLSLRKCNVTCLSKPDKQKQFLRNLCSLEPNKGFLIRRQKELSISAGLIQMLGVGQAKQPTNVCHNHVSARKYGILCLLIHQYSQGLTLGKGLSITKYQTIKSTETFGDSSIVQHHGRDYYAIAMSFHMPLHFYVRNTVLPFTFWAQYCLPLATKCAILCVTY